MSHRPAAIAFAFGVALATTGVAHAQSTTAPPDATPMQKMMSETVPGTMIPLREVAAIGTGVVVGAALWHVVIGHSFVLAGAAIGGWIGDWCYGTRMAPAAVQHTGT